MRAYQITGTEGLASLRPVDVTPPSPGPGQVLVHVSAVSLNYRDYMNVFGIKGVSGPIPRVPCSDGAGTIAEVGPNVTQWKIGDRVLLPFMPTWQSGSFTQEHLVNALGGAVDGTLRDCVIIDAAAPVAVPEDLSLEEAATLPCAAVTAWQALSVRCMVKAGDSVLVLGSGGVSSFALQMAKAMGARVLAVTSSDTKAQSLLGYGADAVFNYKTDPNWDEWVLSQTSGKGVDHVIEIGGAGTLNRSIKAVRFGGSIALIGVLTGVSGDINTVSILRKGITVHGIYVGSREMTQAAVDFVVRKGIRPIVDRVFDFSDAHEAFRHLESAQHMGKIVIRL
jgi:NADPH:quinone reductase-like Zn-dependent oxidoreductase